MKDIHEMIMDILQDPIRESTDEQKVDLPVPVPQRDQIVVVVKKVPREVVDFPVGVIKGFRMWNRLWISPLCKSLEKPLKMQGRFHRSAFDAQLCSVPQIQERVVKVGNEPYCELSRFPNAHGSCLKTSRKKSCLWDCMHDFLLVGRVAGKYWEKWSAKKRTLGA